eukprot:COSAG04_NODE_1235_length_7625_cov_36.004651_2_plen_192_part_00
MFWKKRAPRTWGRRDLPSISGGGCTPAKPRNVGATSTCAARNRLKVRAFPCSHFLDHISPISPPFFLAFCAFSPPGRDGSNEPQAGTQGQETAGKSTKRGETPASPGAQSSRLWRCQGRGLASGCGCPSRRLGACPSGLRPRPEQIRQPSAERFHEDQRSVKRALMRARERQAWVLSSRWGALLNCPSWKP